MRLLFGPRFRITRIPRLPKTRPSRDGRASGYAASLEMLEGRQLLSSGDIKVSEGDAGLNQAVFRIKLIPPLDVPQALTYMTFDVSAKANKDYVPIASTTVIVAPGQKVVTVPVSIIGNIVPQRNRIFGLRVMGARANTFGNAIIVDDDHPVGSHLHVNNPRVREGNQGRATTPAVPSVPGSPSTVPSVPSTIPSVPSTIPSIPSTVPSVPSTIPSVPSTIPSIPNVSV